jgi:hypothetical protein
VPSNSEVLDVVESWSGKRPEKMSQKLEDWWNQTAAGSSHSSLKFDPDGIDDLLLRCKNQFPSSPRPSEADFRAGGNIKTAQDLADALQPVSEMVAADVPMKVVVKKKAAKKKVLKKVGKKRAARKAAPKTRKKAAKKKTAGRKRRR